jgi:hypothetical protein
MWAVAHWTQFTSVGWRYAAAGFLESGGTFVSLVSPDRHDVTIIIETIIIETMTQNLSKTERSNRGRASKRNWTVADLQTVHLNINVMRPSLAAATAPPPPPPQVFHTWHSLPAESVWMQSQGVKTLDMHGKLVFQVSKDQLLTLFTISTGNQCAPSHGRKRMEPLSTNPPALSSSRVPAAEPFPKPWHEDFEDASVHGMPSYFSDLNGAFAVQPRFDDALSGSHDTSSRSRSRSRNNTGNKLVMGQVALNVPVMWGGCGVEVVAKLPFTMFGDVTRTDQTASADFALLQEVDVAVWDWATPSNANANATASCDGQQVCSSSSGMPISCELANGTVAYLVVRAGTEIPGSWVEAGSGYQFTVSSTGLWELSVGAIGGAQKPTVSPKSATVLANGATLPDGLTFPMRTWHTLSLSAHGDVITASFDAVKVAQVVDKTCASGWAGIDTGWHHAQIDDVHLI